MNYFTFHQKQTAIGSVGENEYQLEFVAEIKKKLINGNLKFEKRCVLVLLTNPNLLKVCILAHSRNDLSEILMIPLSIEIFVNSICELNISSLSENNLFTKLVSK